MQIASRHDERDCASAILSGELVWSIKGFAWLEESLFQDEEEYACSNGLQRDRHIFTLYYHPKKGKMGVHRQKASLAIMHENAIGSDGSVAFRYKLFIKNSNQDYVQWGDDGRELVRDDNDEKDYFLFGPDVYGLDDTPSGIFGLSHEQLAKSEWVVDDVMTIKLKVEVRAHRSPQTSTKVGGDSFQEPSPQLIDNLLALLDSGANSDVTFVVQGEAIQAHSLILSAQSKVLQRLFTCGMQESESKTVNIDDCEPLLFKAFLRYLYSDRFSEIEDLLKEQMNCGSSSGDPRTADNSMDGAIATAVGKLLALAHKYDLARLQSWCESKLDVSIDNVCPMLCQAHLYMAKNLETKCLDFIKQRMQEVIISEAFASLVQKWPQVGVLITAHLANVPKEKAAVALDVQEKARKRKRES